MKPLVSIIITCYNKKPYLETTLESVERQTYANLEVILVDDGSNDGSRDVLEQYAASHGNVSLVFQSNQGVSAARNAGINVSNGEFIMSLDADDRIEPTYVERCVEVLEKHSEVKVVQTRASYFGDKTGEFKVPEYSYEGLLWTNLIHYCAMYRRGDFLCTKGYNTNMVHGLEDWDFWLSMLQPEDLVFCVDEALFHWRVLSNSRSIEAEQNEMECYRQLFHNHSELYAPYADRLVYFREKWSQCDTLYHQAMMMRQSKAYRIGKAITRPMSFLKGLFAKKQD